MLGSSDSENDGVPTGRPARDDASTLASLQPWQLLALEQYRELNTNFRSLWDLYIKFYTVFLTANVLAIGVVVERVEADNRPLIAAAFIAQNLLAAATAAGLATYGKTCRRRLEATAALFLPAQDGETDAARTLSRPPIPDTLSVWAGAANVMSHLILIVLWIVVATL
jgi:hypothetical protein